MTIPLPGGPLDDPVVQQKFEVLARAIVDTGGLSLGVRFGTSSATWTAAATSASVGVAHGLGKIPVTILLSSRNIYTDYATNGGTIDATSFQLFGFDTRGAVQTQTLTFDWLAIG